MEFIGWHYTKGLWLYARLVWFNYRRIWHFFSLRILVKTMFWPWKKMVVEERFGMNISKYFEDLSFNLISVGIGLVVRLSLLFFCLAVTLGYAVVAVVGFVWWLAVPWVSFKYYVRIQKRPENILRDIGVRVKNNPEEIRNIIWGSEPGKFVLDRLEKGIGEVLESIKFETEMIGEIKINSFEEVVKWYLERDETTRGKLQQLEMTMEEVVLAAKWWDQKEEFEKEREETRWSLGRPGVGWSLLFGYTPNLNKYGDNLSLKQTFAGNLIGRKEVVNKMERVINSGKSVLLVGQPGVGKMTTVYEFAERAITGKLGQNLAYKRLILLNYQTALAGNMDKDSKKKVLDGLWREAEAAGDVVLVMKDIFRLTNAEFEGNDYTDVLATRLENKKLKMIVLSGTVEYERFLARDSRIMKDFEVVEVAAPTKDEAMMILMQAAEDYEKRLGVRLSVKALKQMLDGSDRYITETPFPEKVLELLAQVMTGRNEDSVLVTADEVNRALSEKTGISVNRLTEGEKEKLINLEEIIHKNLIGQETAVSLIGRSLRGRVAAVKNEERPVGSFLFLGPTGVGKTQTAKVLADVYYGSRKNIIRFDMAEFMGDEGLPRLIGSVERNQVGMMTTAIKNKPASLLLLDEIEKAPPEVYNLFLTLLDEGYINDAGGNRVVCRHLFVVATSNAGSEFIREQVGRGVRGEELQKTVVEYVQSERIFSPEFLNRFDGVVVYEPLTGEELTAVAGLMLQEVKESLLVKNINLEIEEKVPQKLAAEGYDPKFGARPMRRIIDLVIGDVLGRAIIEEKILAGDRIRLVAGEGKDEYGWEKVV